MLAVGLILLGLASRFFVHLPNFTPLLAIALFAGMFLPKRQSVIVPLLLIILSDLLIGFHALILFTWGSVVIIAMMGQRSSSNTRLKNVVMNSLFAAVFFYIVTNFGVWLLYTTYPKSLAGILECYVAAIPYFRNTLISTLIYSIILCKGYEFLAERIKSTRFASVL